MEISDLYLKLLAETKKHIDSGQAANINWFYEVQRMFRVPAHKREHIDLVSAYFRISLMLANTILHELFETAALFVATSKAAVSNNSCLEVCLAR